MAMGVIRPRRTQEQKGPIGKLMSKEIGRIVPIIPTPFRSDDSIHEQDLRRIVRWIGEHGAGVMCTPAYASEYYKLTDEERDQVVSIVIDENDGRVPVVAQANHGSASVAAATAARYEQMGADVLRYLGRVADAVSIPLLVQDFNPGGATISPTEIDELNRQHPNFKYLKLEEPLMIDKLVSIVDTVGDRVGVLEGWGGLYMLELIPNGLIGAMPGVPLLEPLSKVFRLRQAGEKDAAFELMGRLLPFINYSLQNFEVFLQIEKQLLVNMRLFESASIRDAPYTLSSENSEYVDELCAQMQQVIGSL